jgi:alkylation response protein AidB-like acyl-CoA dehydrogenase
MNLHAVRLGAFDVIQDAAGSYDADAIERRTSRVASRAIGVATDATRLAVNVLGGHGFLEDHPCERWYRDAAMLASIDFDPLDAPLLRA